jgi:hypothetical protein
MASGALVGGAGFALATLATLWATPRVVNGVGLENFAVLGLLMAVQGGLLMVLSNPGQLASLTLLAGPAGPELSLRSRAYAAWTVMAALPALLLGWALSAPQVGGLLWSEPLLELQWRDSVPWAGLGWACQLMTQALWSAQRARLRSALAEGQQAVVLLLVVLAAPLAVAQGQGVVGAVSLQALVWVLALLAGLALETALRGDLSLLPKEHRPTWAALWARAGWILAGLFGAGLLMYGDRLYSLQVGPAELAAWAVAGALSLRISSGLGILGPILLPSLATVRGEPARFARLQGLYLRINGTLALALFVPLAAGGAGLLGAWISPDVERLARPWIALLAYSGLAYCLSVAYLNILYSLDQARQGAVSAWLAALFGVGVGAWAQARGHSGAVWMALAGQSLGLALRAAWVQRLGPGGPGLGWMPAALPWAAAALGLAWLLQRSAFPHWFGAGLLPVFLSFGSGILLVLALLLALDALLLRRRGHDSVLSQLLRLWPGRAA